MERFIKMLDQGVNGVTGKVMNSFSTIKRDLNRRSKRRKTEKKEKKQKKQIKKELKKNQLENDLGVEHKYKLTCDLPNCEFHPKPNAYEDFLNTLWCPKSNRASTHSSQIITDDSDRKSNSSFSIEKSDDKESLIDEKLDCVKERLTRLNSLTDDQSSDCSSESLEVILNEKSIKLTVTNENGETLTVVGENSSLVHPDKCMICFNKLKNPIEVMPCTHMFHTHCIEHWLEIKSSCPLCNCKIQEHHIEKYKRKVQRWSD